MENRVENSLALLYLIRLNDSSYQKWQHLLGKCSLLSKNKNGKFRFWCFMHSSIPHTSTHLWLCFVQKTFSLRQSNFHNDTNNNTNNFCNKQTNTYLNAFSRIHIGKAMFLIPRFMCFLSTKLKKYRELTKLCCTHSSVKIKRDRGISCWLSDCIIFNASHSSLVFTLEKVSVTVLELINNKELFRALRCAASWNDWVSGKFQLYAHNRNENHCRDSDNKRKFMLQKVSKEKNSIRWEINAKINK